MATTSVTRRPAAGTRRSTTRDVMEYTASPTATQRRVDRENGVIPGVKILGLTSKNGQSYRPEAVQGATKLYDGAHVFIAHPERSRPDAERSPRDLFGWLESPRFVPGAGLYGDLHYLKAHSMAGTITELAERRPDRLGLSHNAVVQESEAGVYESITRVRSVDLVCKPATTRGIFESAIDEAAEKNKPPILDFRDAVLAKVKQILTGKGDPASKVKEIATAVKELLEAEQRVRTAALSVGSDGPLPGDFDMDGDGGSKPDLASVDELRAPGQKPAALARDVRAISDGVPWIDVLRRRSR